jgi:hypothetical protein
LSGSEITERALIGSALNIETDSKGASVMPAVDA